MWKTNNGGLSWGLQQRTYNDLTNIYFVNQDVGFIVGIGTILKTTNGGGGFIPVELTSFRATYSKNDVQLNWSTASELNNLGFEIERSTNRSDWRIIGFREGKGTSTEPQEYSFTDDLFGNNSYILYYRLQQIDFDGSFEYSFIVEAEVKTPDEFYLSQN